MIMKEVAPLVNAQVGAFFLAVEPGVDEFEAATGRVAALRRLRARG